MRGWPANLLERENNLKDGKITKNNENLILVRFVEG